MTCNVLIGTLNPTHPLTTQCNLYQLIGSDARRLGR